MQSLEQQYLHLSPLDAFKAKGRYLHEQLKREGKGPKEAHNNKTRESVETSDAFDLDHKLRARRSNYLVVADHAPSIYSERAVNHELSRSSSSTSSYSRASHKETSSDPDISGAPDESLSNTAVVSTQVMGNIGAPLSPNHIDSEFAKVTMQSAPLSQSSSRNSPSGSSVRQESQNLGNLDFTQTPLWNDAGSPTLARNHSAGSRTPSHSHISNSVHAQAPQQASGHKSPLHGSNSTRARNLPSRALSYSPVTPSSSSSASPRRPPLSVSGAAGSSSSRAGSRTNTLINTRVASLPDAKLSATIHIELGIEQHEANELPQSTHHFKVAADLGDPTGCLLYGLSLRHGWGVRQDLQRSIAMLQKAVDSIGLDIDNIRGSKLMNLSLMGEVAVAIYELGVSYKNGWGVQTDKKLALKYFEIASTWGDVEAMVVAADCYLRGEGCKKDKAKAATYLRRAESLGKKEIGNSWIWKSKYDA